MVVLLSNRMQTIEGDKMKFSSWWKLMWAIAFGIVASKIILIVFEMVATGLAIFVAMLFRGGI